MDMSAACLEGMQQLPQAVVCYDRFHVAALAGNAMDEVRSTEFRVRSSALTQALGELSLASRRSLSWVMRTHHACLDGSAYASDVHPAALEFAKCSGLAPEGGAARGVRSGAAQSQRGCGPRRVEALDRLGDAKSPGALSSG
jgi:Transposase